MTNYTAKLQLNIALECNVEADSSEDVQNYIANTLLSGQIGLNHPENIKILNLESGKLKIKKVA